MFMFDFPKMKEEQVAITRWSRKKDNVLPESVFSDDELLCTIIVNYCKDQGLNPIFIDRNIAIFPKEYKGAYYKKDLEQLQDE